MPDTPTTPVFIVWDFDQKSILADLVELREKPPAGFDVQVHDPIKIGHGRTWSDIVRPAIDASEIVVALLDEPNANVAFEIGYALGTGKTLKFGRLRKSVPNWLDHTGLENPLLTNAWDLDLIEALVTSDGGYPANPWETGERTVVLCPEVGGGKTFRRRLREERPDWGLPEVAKWTEPVATTLAGAGRVIWIVTQTSSDCQGKHGQQNSAAAVLAGCALGRGAQLEVWRDEQAPIVADVHNTELETTFAGRAGLLELLEREGQPEPEPGDVLACYRRYCRTQHGKLVSFFGDSDNRTLADVHVDLTVSHSELREKVHGEACAPSEVPRAATLREVLALPRGEFVTGRWALLGDPGAGKSTASRYLNYTLAAEEESTAGAPTVVFVSLARWVRKGGRPFELVERDVLDAYGEKHGKGLAEALDAKAEAGELVLILDGLDEVASDELQTVRGKIMALAESMQHATILVTSRKIGFEPLEGFRTAQLEGLGLDKQETLLSKWLGEGGAKSTLETLEQRPRLLAEADNPLVLTMIALLVCKHGKLAKNRVELYREVTRVLLEHGQSPGANKVKDVGTATDVLAALSLRLQQAGGAEAWPRETLSEELWNVGDKLSSRLHRVWGSHDGFLDDIANNAGILAPHDGPGEDWKFLHRSMREFLTARAMHAAGDAAWFDLLDDLEDDALGQWAEVYGMLAGLADDPAELMTTIRNKSPALFVRALPETDTIEPKVQLGLLFGCAQPDESNPHWNGDHLRTIVRPWQRRAESRALLCERITQGMPLNTLAWLMWCIEMLEPEAGLDDCFERAGLNTARPTLDRVPIPAGEFRVGGEQLVSVSPFEIMPTTVTVEHWQHFTEGEIDGSEQLPARSVWWQAWLFARWVGGRLPYECEWEYACRAGTTGEYGDGSAESDLDAVGWYARNSGGRPHEVGQKKPNAWGLYDMHGNVWEWCQDGLRKYGEQRVVDPRGPSSGDRALRGGCFFNAAVSCRASDRGGDDPGYRIDGIGFRVVWPSLAVSTLGT